MEIAAIRYVLEVEKTGSIGIAARKLYLSPPTVSYAIKTLEAELGGELFHRSNKGVVLTSLGRQFVDFARPFYQQYEYLEEICGSFSPVRPSLSVVSSPQKTVSNTFVELCQKYAPQQCHLSFNELPVEDILQQVQDHVADLGVVIFVSHWKKTIMRLVKLKNLSYTPLTKEHPQVIMRSSHPLCAKKPEYLTFAQLQGYPYVTSYVGAFQYTFPEHEGPVPNTGKQGQILVHNRAAMYDILHSTDAYCISSYNRIAYAGKAFDDGIVTIPLEPVDFHLEVGWVKPQAVELSEIGSEFIQKLSDMLMEYRG